MKNTISILIFALAIFSFWSCKKDDDDNNTPTNKQYALVIKTGGQAVDVGNQFTFQAQLVGTDGSILPITSGITYTSSNADVASFAGNVVTGKGAGTATVTATYSYNGVTYTAQVPLAIQPPSMVFAVNPWTIWWEADGTEFELNPIYFGTTVPTYTYTSSDPTIASVSAAGVVKVLKAGSCVVTVTATNLPNQPKVQVPVLVFGEIAVPLPVAQVKITPGAYEMFKDEEKVFTAKAFNGSGNEVTGKTVKWSILTTDSSDAGEAATIDQTGKVKALRVGEAVVYAEIEGIVSQANITINPDFALFVEPFSTSIVANATKSFTLKTYQVDRAKYRANAPDAVSLVPNPSSVQWVLPLENLPGFPSSFSIVSSTNNSCNVKASASAIAGMPGFLVAFVNDDRYAAGGASITVAVGDDCDCGAQNTQVVNISVASTNVSMQAFLGSPFSLNAVAENDLGGPVSGADIRYCSDNIMVASVSSDGTITAVQPGTATITVCVGSVKKLVNVTVTP
jgi:uncharacterized protein YjdB